jgi:glycosyltransferase involved in cell wall biosynthesis
VTLAVLVRSFPRLTQTFILDELLGLEELGLDVRLFALAEGDRGLRRHEHLQRLRASVTFLDPAPAREVRRYIRSLSDVWREADHRHGYHAGSRWRAWGQAVALSRQLEACGAAHLHAHFAHDPALVGALAARLTGLPFTFTAHARDVHQVSRDALARRAAAARTVVACCEVNRRALEGVAPHAVLVHHGVDLDRFSPGPRPDGSAAILTVARLVEKKGVGHLLAALARLREDVRLDIYGEGPLRPQLEAAAERLEVAGRVRFLGAATQAELVQAYRSASVFALTPLRTPDGDVDGIPNVILEAMASGLPVVSTTAGGVPEAVIDGRDGVLAAPGDVDGIAAALRALLADDDLRRRMGRAARATVEARFDRRRAAQTLRDLFATTTAM